MNRTEIIMNRAEIINELINKYGYTSYLEIGINNPNVDRSWEKIKVDIKHGIDPNFETTYQMTSDEFFSNHVNQNYDIIFVDGLHVFEQVYKDIKNSLKYLNNSGTIIVHDCNPLNEIVQRPERVSDAWNGDVWKAIVKLRMEEIDLTIHTVDTDEGCAIIRRGSQVLLPVSPEENPYDYSFLERRRVESLNLISVEEFKRIYL
jgi:hypothetical protein